jgi:Zn ribbon nucleic-acid-binding protein
VEQRTGVPKNQAEAKQVEKSSAAQRSAERQTPELSLLELQHAAGNRAVGRFFQSRLTGQGSSGGTDEQKSNAAPLKPLGLPAQALVQRKCACGSVCPDCAKKETLQLKGEPGIKTADAHAAEHLRQQGDGHPLDPAARSFFEGGFGFDFSRVRVHHDAQAADSAGSLKALAYTYGHNIVFRNGHYSPDTREGRKLLGHELAHVVQQSGGEGIVQGAGLDHDAYEAEADRAAEQALAGRSVSPLTPIGASLVQRQGDGEETHTHKRREKSKKKDDAIIPPYVDMEASLQGLTFIPDADDTFKAGTRIDQANARMLRRLVGDEYRPDILKKFDALRPAGGFREYGNVSGVAKGGEAIGRWIVHAPFALRIIQWLQDGSAGRRYEVYVSPSQLERLTLGIASRNAWQDLQEFMAREGLRLPAWYGENIFVAEMASQGELLRLYEASTRPPENEPGQKPTEKGGVLRSIYDAISMPAAALDRIRADAALTGHTQYRKLWPSAAGKRQDAHGAAKQSKQAATRGPEKGTSAEAAPHDNTAPQANAAPIAPDGKVDTRRAALFLSFIRTQPVLLGQVSDDTDVGAKARLELFDRFDRFFETATARRYGGDQQILAHPAKANTPPFPSRLYAYPALQPPFFDASTTTDHAFYNEFEFRKIFEGFTVFKFQWSMFRIPDTKFVDTATLDDKQRVETTWGDIYSQRFARDERYAAADVDRILQHWSLEFGPPGSSPYDLVQLNNLLRYTGTAFETFTQQIAEPQSVKHYSFKDEGLHVVRCAAVPFLSENAEVVRPPSVAYLPVFARAPAKIGETRVRTALLMQEQAAKRRDEINKLLHDNPSDPNRKELEEELNAINASLGTVKDTLTYQRRLLDGDPKPKVPLSEESRQAQLKQIENILSTRTKRGLDDARTERLIATHVTDLGDTLQLVLEAVDRTKGPGPPYTYFVSDATTPSGSEADATANAKPDAIAAAVKKLLDKSEYGRGLTSLYIDKAVRPIRVEASGTKMLMEALGNLSTVGSLIAVAAAPFTGGSSLAFLVPLGVAGAVPSAYNLVRRWDEKTFHWDMATTMDIVNILGAVAGLGSEVATARGAASAAKVGQAAATTRRILTLSNAFAITGVGAGGFGVLLMGAQFYEQIEGLKNLPPGLRSARLLQIVGRALVDVGIQAGGIIADKSRLHAAEEAIGSRPAVEGVEEGARQRLSESLGEKAVERLGGDAVTLLNETHTPGEVKALIERVGEPAARELVVSAGREGLEAVESRGLRELVDAIGERGLRRLLKTLADLPDAASRSLRLAQEWVSKVVKLPAGIVERLLLDAIGRLRKLPFWILERLADLKESVLETLLGCSSPCKVSHEAIIEYFTGLSAEEKAKAKPLKTVDDVLAALPPDINRTKIERYLKDNKRPALRKLIEAGGITDLDLKKLGDFVTDSDRATTQEGYRSSYRMFVRYLTQILPSKVPDIRQFNRILAEVVAAEPRQGAALKGPAFEAFIRQHVPEFMTEYQRVGFDKGGKLKLEKTRTSDFFIVISEAAGIRTGDLWDFKHTDRVDPAQAKDYSKIKNHNDPKLDKVRSVNYLFPELEWAKKNAWLARDYGFNLFYLDEHGVKWPYVPDAPPLKTAGTK